MMQLRVRKTNLEVLQDDPKSDMIFPQPTFIAITRDKNLGNYL